MATDPTPKAESLATLIRRIVTGDGAQLENLDMADAEWHAAGLVIDGPDYVEHFEVTMRFDDWLALVHIAQKDEIADAHRCSGCGHRWDGPLRGTDLCGDCWRKAQPIVHVEARPSVVDKTKVGLYRKFIVTRTDGSDAPGEKHDGCSYYVLDLTHDKHAIPALRAYAKSCGRRFPLLARDLEAIVNKSQAARACEGCGDPIPDGEPMFVTSDEVELCRPCWEALA